MTRISASVGCTCRAAASSNPRHWLLAVVAGAVVGGVRNWNWRQRRQVLIWIWPRGGIPRPILILLRLVGGGNGKVLILAWSERRKLYDTGCSIRIGGILRVS